jgi:hypothetical protein
MTGLFVGLVQRGAGIRPSAGTPLLVPRRRSRFEPISGLPDSAGDVRIEDTTSAAASIIARLPDEAASRRSMERSETPADAEPASARRPILTIGPDGIPIDRLLPADASAAAPPRRSEPGPQPHIPALAASIQPSEPSAAAEAKPTDRAAPAVAGYDNASIELLREHRTSPSRLRDITDAAPAVTTAAVQQFSTIALGEPEPMPPQVTIAIERIDIALAPPPVSPTANRPAIARTSGFAAYARARRGIPR